MKKAEKKNQKTHSKSNAKKREAKTLPWLRPVKSLKKPRILVGSEDDAISPWA
jgi:hypothetical protein